MVHGPGLKGEGRDLAVVLLPKRHRDVVGFFAFRQPAMLFPERRDNGRPFLIMLFGKFAEGFRFALLLGQAATARFGFSSPSEKYSRGSVSLPSRAVTAAVAGLTR